jgi:hypothetical protein
MSDQLKDIINQALESAGDPPNADNLEKFLATEGAPTTESADAGTDVEAEIAEETVTGSEESTEEETPAAEESDADVSETEDTESDADEADDAASTEETFEVKIDGEPVKVTLKEALAGYQRQADYTRKAQSLATEREAFETQVSQMEQVLEQVAALDQTWEENPVQVISHFAANTENPTHALALTIKELAAANLLEPQFLEIFGITPEVRAEWAKESEISQLRKKANAAESTAKSFANEKETEAAVQQAIAEYERQIDQIIAEEGLSLSSDDRVAFRVELASYARDNDLTNLKAAYKAKRYEESKTKKAVVEKTAKLVKEKRATSAAARNSSTASGSAPMSQNADLRSTILAAMKEQG